MAVTQVYTAIPNDVITAARWNNEFGNIYNNGTAIAFPVTTAVSFAGMTITLDAAGATTVVSSASQGINLTPGAKAGTPNTTGKSVNVVANTFTDTATAGSGTATAFASTALQQPTLAAQNASVTCTDAATLYVAAAPANGTNVTVTNPWAIWVDAGNVRFDAALTVSGGLTGTIALGKHIEGLTYANNVADATNDIDIAVGSATSTHATPASRVLLSLTTAVTKRLDASWVTGTNQGGLSSSLSIGDNDYYIHLIRVAGVDDVGFDTSITAANLVTDHSATHYRLIGWFKRVAGTIVAFDTYETDGGGLEFQWDAPTTDVNLSNTLTTTRRTDTVKVPLNFSVLAHLAVNTTDASGAFYAIVYCPDQADLVPNSALANMSMVGGFTTGDAKAMWVRTSTTGTVAARANIATVDAYVISTLGFRWARRN